MKMKTMEVGIDVVADDIVVNAHEKGAVGYHKNMSGVGLIGFNEIEGAFGAVEGLLESLAIAKIGIEVEIKKILWP